MHPAQTRLTPALTNLYRSWIDHRIQQVRDYCLAYRAQHGQQPSAHQVLAHIEPPLASIDVARYYLEASHV